MVVGVGVRRNDCGIGIISTRGSHVLTPLSS